MARRLLTAAALTAVLSGVAGCGSSSGSGTAASWPSRSTPMHSTLGWFEAINAHNRPRLLSYVAVNARDQMGWANESRPWARFKDVRCSARPSDRSRPDLRCTFHEVGTLAEMGNQDSFWDVYLEHTGRGWVIDSYGQG
jgi:hypothetical protein